MKKKVYAHTHNAQCARFQPAAHDAQSVEINTGLSVFMHQIYTKFHAPKYIQEKRTNRIRVMRSVK